MGYACPVCGDPQADATHLANHLAFTALARGGDHEDWLDERVPQWETLGEETLGERLVAHAEEAEYPQVFEDTTGDADRHGREHDPGHPADEHTHANEPRGGRETKGGNDATRAVEDARSRVADGAFADDAGDVLDEARELTRRRRENAGADADGDGGELEDSETE